MEIQEQDIEHLLGFIAQILMLQLTHQLFGMTHQTLLVLQLINFKEQVIQVLKHFMLIEE